MPLIVRLIAFFGIAFLILANYYIFLDELLRPIPAAIRPLAHVAVVSSIFGALAWRKLENFKVPVRNYKKDIIFGFAALILLVGRYLMFDSPYSTFLSFFGLAALAIFIFGMDTIKQIYKNFTKEITYTIVIYIILLY